MAKPSVPSGFQNMLEVSLIEALLGRRSRRFFLGAKIPDGVFAYTSGHDPVPLSELEKLLIVASCGGNTSWHYMIYRGRRYAPHLSNYAGTLMLGGMGLGGWMFNGIDPFAMLGASGESDVPGLGFRYDSDERWPYPNPTGLEGVMEGCCPPHYTDMRAAVEAVCERKFGPDGPFHPDTPGPWKDSAKVRSAAQIHDERFRECIALQAQYVYDTFGKFPGTVPSMFLIRYLQAHHIDLEFYDKFYKPGAYLKTHAEHMTQWHS